ARPEVEVHEVLVPVVDAAPGQPGQDQGPDQFLAERHEPFLLGLAPYWKSPDREGLTAPACCFRHQSGSVTCPAHGGNCGFSSSFFFLCLPGGAGGARWSSRHAVSAGSLSFTSSAISSDVIER